MKDAGAEQDEKPKKVIVDCGYKFPPKRTRREWNDIYKLKMRGLEIIQMEYLGRRSIFSDGDR